MCAHSLSAISKESGSAAPASGRSLSHWLPPSRMQARIHRRGFGELPGAHRLDWSSFRVYLPKCLEKTFSEVQRVCLLLRHHQTPRTTAALARRARTTLETEPTTP